MVDISNMMVSFMEVDEKTLEEKEVVEVVVEVIEVNNQIATQIAKNCGETWAHGKELLSKGACSTKWKAATRELCINR
jgi:hypothetical protein